MITEKDVEYIASLSRIHLRQEEIVDLTQNLEKILNHIKKLKEADISNIEATSHVLTLNNVYRDDKIYPSLKQTDVLKMAVSTHQGSFKVPKVIE